MNKLILQLAVSLFAIGLVAEAIAQKTAPLPPMPDRPEAATGPTRVGYWVYVGDVTNIDGAAQIFSANFVMVLRWRDPPLAHAGPGARQAALSDVWHPRLLWRSPPC